jgi:hypothetical protein
MVFIPLKTGSRINVPAQTLSVKTTEADLNCVHEQLDEDMRHKRRYLHSSTHVRFIDVTLGFGPVKKQKRTQTRNPAARRYPEGGRISNPLAQPQNREPSWRGEGLVGGENE